MDKQTVLILLQSRITIEDCPPALSVLRYHYQLAHPIPVLTSASRSRHQVFHGCPLFPMQVPCQRLLVIWNTDFLKVWAIHPPIPSQDLLFHRTLIYSLP